MRLESGNFQRLHRPFSPVATETFLRKGREDHGLDFFIGKRQKAPRKSEPFAFRLSKKSRNFFDSLKKCRYFCAAQRRKSPRFACRNPCTARLPGHLIPFEAGGCPLELPRLDSGRFYSAQVFRQTAAKGSEKIGAFCLCVVCVVKEREKWEICMITGYDDIVTDN